MNRTERLYALVETLRARPSRPTSVRELAERFEVSDRTIERDLYALQQTGVPIWAEQGRRGGYRLDPARTLPPLNLTADEAVAIAMSLSGSPSTPFHQSLRSAFRKLLATMGRSELEDGERLARRIRVAGLQSEADAQVVEVLTRAVFLHRVVDLSYVDRQGRATRRLVEAHGVATNGRVWYLIGWCRTRQERRMFRLERVREARLTDDPVPDRDLDAMLGWIGSRSERLRLSPDQDIAADC